MGIVGSILNIMVLLIIIFLISRVAHFFNNTKTKLDEMDKKIDELRELISNQK